jgi:hypothetical protein
MLFEALVLEGGPERKCFPVLFAVAARNQEMMKTMEGNEQ